MINYLKRLKAKGQFPVSTMVSLVIIIDGDYYCSIVNLTRTFSTRLITHSLGSLIQLVRGKGRIPIQKRAIEMIDCGLICSFFHLFFH
jgi:hypothetical protein